MSSFRPRLALQTRGDLGRSDTCRTVHGGAPRLGGSDEADSRAWIRGLGECLRQYCCTHDNLDGAHGAKAIRSHITETGSGNAHQVDGGADNLRREEFLEAGYVAILSCCEERFNQTLLVARTGGCRSAARDVLPRAGYDLASLASASRRTFAMSRYV